MIPKKMHDAFQSASTQVKAPKKIDWDKTQGLIPAIIQHAKSGQVLMLGFMNPDALKITLETKKVTFWSRTKERLWTKGEKSGHFLDLVAMSLDCDQDTVLVQALPKGPTCHRGTSSCFVEPLFKSKETNTPDFSFLYALEKHLASRKNEDASRSYTASLYAQGTKRISQKVGEEGVEVALAATSGDKKELVEESADLMYHLLVLLQDQNLSLGDVIYQLKKRHAKSAEKNK